MPYSIQVNGSLSLVLKSKMMIRFVYQPATYSFLEFEFAQPLGVQR